MENVKKESVKSSILKTFFVGIFGMLKAERPRAELEGIFGAEKLVEMEIALYAEEKRK